MFNVSQVDAQGGETSTDRHFARLSLSYTKSHVCYMFDYFFTEFITYLEVQNVTVEFCDFPLVRIHH